MKDLLQISAFFNRLSSCHDDKSSWYHGKDFVADFLQFKLPSHRATLGLIV
ncbi:hypothetical protein A2U01_0108836, partial [Trifolium medium]|nr:hypothetical protein [Trifolium medium]